MVDHKHKRIIKGKSRTILSTASLLVEINHVVNVCDVILQRGNHFNSFILRDSCRR